MSVISRTLQYIDEDYFENVSHFEREKRLAICNECPDDALLFTRRCKYCGCFMDEKTNYKYFAGEKTVCPAGFW